ncbi:MAG: branched-chain amino acid ABC transporter permease [Parcubacteria group bacterium QH_9_35_7]|nr:MAG: branched-chain amino acid ABC transporter permease [Parcubacteria group bacterium QH_9_35_7]
MVFSQLLVNGLIAGSIYALIASGFSLIYTTNRFLHFAHGTMAAGGAYLTWLFFQQLGLNFAVSSLLAIVATALLGVIVFLVVYKPLKDRGSSSAVLLMAGLALLILLENLILLIFGADVKSINFLKVGEGWTVLGANITTLQLTIIGTSVVLLVLLWLFINHTRLGKIMRAVADNPELAKISGINTERIQIYGFAIGSALAGVAGLLIGMEQNLEPTMGTSLIIKGFTGSVIGGVTSLPGSVLGSYLVGLVENFGVWWLPSGYKDAIAFTLLLVFLLIKPSGILGIKKGLNN